MHFERSSLTMHISNIFEA